MTRIKAIWNSELGKILISFTGLLLLLSSLTIVPLITYTTGDSVTIRLYDVSDEPLRGGVEPYVQPGILGTSQVDESVLQGALKDAYDNGENFYSILRDTPAYATLDIDGIASIQAVSLETPPAGAVYLEIDDIYPTFDIERSEAFQEETGEWREFYDGVEIRMSDMISAIESRTPDLRERLLTGPLDVELRIWNGYYVIVNP